MPDKQIGRTEWTHPLADIFTMMNAAVKLRPHVVEHCARRLTPA